MARPHEGTQQITPDLLRRAGRALYGNHWKAPLADDLEINLRTIERWESGSQEIPPGVAQDLAQIIDRVLTDLKDVRLQLQIHLERII